LGKTLDTRFSSGHKRFLSLVRIFSAVAQQGPRQQVAEKLWVA
jgi:hypothetical protein